VGESAGVALIPCLGRAGRYHEAFGPFAAAARAVAAPADRSRTPREGLAIEGKTKKVAILGSTGSIGRQGLEVIAAQEDLSACALAAGGNWSLLAEQARRFGAAVVAIADPAAGEPLTRALGPGVRVLAGEDAQAEMIASGGADVVLSGVVGSCGLRAALAAIAAGVDLAIANKETLVMAGRLVTEAAGAAGVALLPVDSEHSAIHQCLAGRDGAEVRRIIITASGGPFRTWPAEKIQAATVGEALNHPTWQMGPKITIDSATMMNKALEIIEAHWLFGFPGERISVLIHPESIVHSLVEFHDGSVLAQMGRPDMTTPIAYALNYPRRVRREVPPLELTDPGRLHFAPVDAERFPAVELAYRALETGRGAGAVLNGANEAAVAAFLDGKIRFGQIVPLVEETLNKHSGTDETDVDALLDADRWARQQVSEAIGLAS